MKARHAAREHDDRVSLFCVLKEGNCVNKYIHKGEKNKTILFVFEIRDNYFTRINILGSSNSIVHIAASYGLDYRRAGVRDTVRSSIFSSPRRPY
jgi:hypothetical protein